MSVSGTPTPGLATQSEDLSSTQTPTHIPEEPSSPGGRRSGTGWSLDRFDPRIVRALTVVGFALPAIAYLVFIRHYQINAVWDDQWDEVPIIRQSFVHFPDWSSLWTLHNNNRMLFPNLIVVGLAHWFRYNLDLENFLGAFMLFGATALLIWSHKRRSEGTPLLFYCPVAFLTLTIAQYQNSLWGFQLAWYLILLALAASIFWLDRFTLTWPVFVLAALAGIVGSYSSVQGLLIWPVGLVLLYHRRRAIWTFVSWVGVAAITTILYFHNAHYNNQINDEFLRQHPLQGAKVFLYALGDILGQNMTYGTPGNPWVMAFGLFILVMAVFVVIRWGLRRDDRGAAPIGVALIIFGILFDALVTDGRVIFGLWASTASRYVTNDVLVLAGIYLTVLGRTSRVSASTGLEGTGVQKVWRGVFRWIDRIPRRVLTAVAIGAIAIQVVVSIPLGIHDTRQFHRYFVADVYVSQNMNRLPAGTVEGVLYFVRSEQWLKQQAQFLREHHLAQFG